MGQDSIDRAIKREKSVAGPRMLLLIQSSRCRLHTKGNSLLFYQGRPLRATHTHTHDSFSFRCLIRKTQIFGPSMLTLS